MVRISPPLNEREMDDTLLKEFTFGSSGFCLIPSRFNPLTITMVDSTNDVHLMTRTQGLRTAEAGLAGSSCLCSPSAACAGPSAARPGSTPAPEMKIEKL